MIKKILLFLILITVITGCSLDKVDIDKKQDEKVIGYFENVKIVDKNRYLRPLRFVITIEKNDDRLELQMLSEDSYAIIQKGNIVSVGYTKDYKVKEIKFPKFEEKK